MPSSDTAEQLHVKLRLLAAEDPRKAQAFVNELLDSNHPCLQELLRRITVPGEGRTRQIVANAVRPRQDKGRLARMPLD